MNCITLWQPWATWIALGWKTIETRTHRRFASLVGQRIGIHAGKKWDEMAINSAIDYLDDWQIDLTMDFPDMTGRIVCTAMVIDHLQLRADHGQAALIECYSCQRWGLMLADVRKQTGGPVIQGKQGIWKYEQKKTS